MINIYSTEMLETRMHYLRILYIRAGLISNLVEIDLTKNLDAYIIKCFIQHIVWCLVCTHLHGSVISATHKMFSN